MIKFFRKIRQRLLTENKFSKYLLYAIGEIILVIIGILIALQINNRNELRKSEEQAISTLLQVHTELAENIKDIDGMFLDFLEKDTIVNNIMNNRYNPDNYMERYSYIDPLNYWSSLDIRDHSFQKMILNTNRIPEKYNEIINDLQRLYTDDKGYVQSSSEEMIEFVEDYANWKKSNTTWYQYTYGKIKPELTNEEIAFYFSDDSPYKNFVRHYAYRDGLLLESVTTFRYEAFQFYKKLAKTLNLSSDEIESFSIGLTSEEIENILGTYKFEKYTIEVFIKDDKLFYQLKTKDETKDEKEMFFISKSFFVIDSKYREPFMVFRFDSNNNVLGMTIRKADYKAEGQKAK